MNIQVNPEDAESFFFRAMLNGYATDAVEERNAPLPGWKTVRFKEGDYELVDMWHTTTGSTRSSGITTIFYQNLPIWSMHYGGWYAKDAIKALQAALKKSYELGVFIGGRGPKTFKYGKYWYDNTPKGSGDFIGFEGSEYIEDIDEHTMVGYHWYQGSWLLEFE